MTEPTPNIPKGYGWVGTISRQYGAWLCYWNDNQEEGYSAHGSLASAKQYLHREVFGSAPLRYELLDNNQIHVYAKGIGDDA